MPAAKIDAPAAAGKETPLKKGSWALKIAAVVLLLALSAAGIYILNAVMGMAMIPYRKYLRDLAISFGGGFFAGGVLLFLLARRIYKKPLAGGK